MMLGADRVAPMPLMAGIPLMPAMEPPIVGDAEGAWGGLIPPIWAPVDMPCMPDIPLMEPMPLAPMPMSAMLRTGRGSIGGTSASMPGWGARVARA